MMMMTMMMVLIMNDYVDDAFILAMRYSYDMLQCDHNTLSYQPFTFCLSPLLS